MKITCENENGEKETLNYHIKLVAAASCAGNQDAS